MSCLSITIVLSGLDIYDSFHTNGFRNVVIEVQLPRATIIMTAGTRARWLRPGRIISGIQGWVLGTREEVPEMGFRAG